MSISLGTNFAERRSLERRARQLAWASIAWHVTEGILGVAFGVAAGSVALIGFGADSFIETAAGAVVLWRMTGARITDAHRERAERRASRLIAITFYLLAIYVFAHSALTLATGEHPESSIPGIILAIITAIAMPPLAIAKQRIGRKLDSCATSSEGAQNMICAYLSVGLLIGLTLNASLGWWWADPVVAIAIGIVAVAEGRKAWRGDVCCC